MKRSAFIALSLGLAVFVALLSWRGAGLIAATFVAAGWGLLAVALFHLVPLLLDTAAMHVLADRQTRFGATLGARWAGESVNSLMPAGQMGGPVVMARMLAGGTGSMSAAGALVAVATTQQVLAQALFAILGVALLSLRTGSGHLVLPLIAGISLFTLSGTFLYRLQRRGLFGRLGALTARLGIGSGAGGGWARRAARLDAMVESMYAQARSVRACFGLNLLGWLVGTGEVWLALHFIGHPVSLLDALLLESLGQAIRGIAFAIPGALGVQEGGFLLLAPFVGLSPEAALALSLCKRTRELLFGLPGLGYWHWRERLRRRAAAVAPHGVPRPVPHGVPGPAPHVVKSP
ncbi:lysylphosphatidylglycerol synthase domain-containing protein [Robbsia sp. Bb-Pol-6]|uniref:Lysylphosphatidylglycerol synthase domain-containing protein n=1 Tax=Robbsia betulipollinis TaxID=2981849 RepID=A0ABT3ZN08_9BURK|nr:lysylphosphatidylglycerol synthase domain-containing protein [Robbsia betulipollinis]MCY0387944.1 lysylphosphatidylglycerol synthase domain-containing protein [Robbsia betulipollinis]